MKHQGRQEYLLATADKLLPLYFQPWWLDAVVGEKGWNAVLSRDRGGDLTGVWVYCERRVGGLSVIEMPKLTAYSGPLFFYPTNLTTTEARYAFEKKVLQELLVQLPRVAFFYQEWHPDIQNWLPAYWDGYQQTTHYTYLLENLQDLNRIFEGFRSNVRTHIRKAEKTIRIVASDDVEALFSLYRLSLSRQGKKPQVSFAALQGVDEVLRIRQQRLLLLAEDESGQYHAGMYLTYDHKSAYYLLSGTDPSLRSSGALYLLVWSAIQQCSRLGLSFDFEGSMLEPVEEVFRGFSGKLTPHYKVVRAQNRLLEALAVIFRKRGF